MPTEARISGSEDKTRGMDMEAVEEVEEEEVVVAVDVGDTWSVGIGIRYL